MGVVPPFFVKLKLNLKQTQPDWIHRHDNGCCQVRLTKILTPNS